MISFEVLVLIVPALIILTGVVFCASIVMGIVFWLLSLPLWIPAILFVACLFVGIHQRKVKRRHHHPLAMPDQKTKPNVYDFTLPEGFYIESLDCGDFKK